MMRHTAPRSIFGPVKQKTAEVISFPSGRPEDEGDTGARADLARRCLMTKFGYSDAEAQLIIDDYMIAGSAYSVWDETIDVLFRVR